MTRIEETDGTSRDLDPIAEQAAGSIWPDQVIVGPDLWATGRPESLGVRQDGGTG
jgi:hypothetical protein